MIKIIVNGQSVTLSYPVIASDSIDYLEADVSLSDEWKGCESVWANFEKRGIEHKIELHDGKIVKDDHLNLSEGQWQVSVFGIRGDTRITSVPATLFVSKSGSTDGEVLPSIPLSASEQIARNAAEAVRIAQSVRDDADSGKFKGDPGDGYELTDEDIEDIADKLSDKIEPPDLSTVKTDVSALNTRLTDEENARQTEDTAIRTHMSTQDNAIAQHSVDISGLSDRIAAQENREDYDDSDIRDALDKQKLYI